MGKGAGGVLSVWGGRHVKGAWDLILWVPTALSTGARLTCVQAKFVGPTRNLRAGMLQSSCTVGGLYCLY